MAGSWNIFFSTELNTDSTLSLDAFQQIDQRASDCLMIAIGAFPRSYHKIQTVRDSISLSAKGFSNVAFPLIANHGISYLSRDRHSHPTVFGSVDSRGYHQHLIRSIDL